VIHSKNPLGRCFVAAPVVLFPLDPLAFIIHMTPSLISFLTRVFHSKFLTTALHCWKKSFLSASVQCLLSVHFMSGVSLPDPPALRSFCSEPFPVLPSNREVPFLAARMDLLLRSPRALLEVFLGGHGLLFFLFGGFPLAVSVHGRSRSRLLFGESGLLSDVDFSTSPLRNRGLSPPPPGWRITSCGRSQPVAVAFSNRFSTSTAGHVGPHPSLCWSFLRRRMTAWPGPLQPSFFLVYLPFFSEDSEGFEGSSPISSP